VTGPRATNLAEMMTGARALIPSGATGRSNSCHG